MNKTITAQIQCPFFSFESNKLLCCEGFIEGTCMTTKFESQKIKTQYIKAHCFCIDGGNCIFAKNLYEKYKLQEEKELEEKIKKLTTR